MCFSNGSGRSSGGAMVIVVTMLVVKANGESVGYKT